MRAPNPVTSAPTAANQRAGVRHAGTFRRVLAQHIPAATISRIQPTNMKAGCRASRVSMQYQERLPQAIPVRQSDQGPPNPRIIGTLYVLTGEVCLLRTRFN